MNYKQTKSFLEFQCVGGSCISTCCRDWKVEWKKENIDKLQSAPGCPDNISEAAVGAFVPDDESGTIYHICHGQNGFCPFLSGDGLCGIQKSIGEEYLSDICITFPRRYFAAKQNIYCSCSLSCPVVFQGLIDEENAAVLLTCSEKPHIRGEVHSAADNPALVKLHPELKYHKELLEFFYEIIADKRYSAEVNIVRGALAAENLSETVKQRGAGKLAGAIAELREALAESDVIKVIDDVRPEYSAKLRLLAAYTQKAFGTGLTALFGGEAADAEKFARAEERLNDVFRDKPFWFGNIALNLLLEHLVPFRYPNKTIYENYSEYAAVAAVIRLCAMAAVMRDSLSIDDGRGGKLEFRGNDRIAGLCSMVSRQINQNIGEEESPFRQLSAGGITPRDIAMLIK